MPGRNESADTVLKRRVTLFKQKIAEERIALKFNQIGPGNPVELPFGPGESRFERLAHWESTVVAITQMIDAL